MQELAKYTDDPVVQDRTQAALGLLQLLTPAPCYIPPHSPWLDGPGSSVAAMKGVAEAVNEDKRRLEDLETIDAWQQSTVDNWAVRHFPIHTQHVARLLTAGS